MRQPQPPIRVLLASSNPRTAAALADLLGGDPRTTIVATAGDADAAVRLAVAHRPDVALVDVGVTEGGLRVVSEIRRAAPGTRVVALSAQDDQASVAAMLRAGAVESVDRGAPVDEILEALERASHGLVGLPGAAAARASEDVSPERCRPETNAGRAGLHADEIREVLETGAIRGVYQPVFELATGRVVGYEGLARVDREPRRGPEFWFAAAAEAGLQDQLELAAIRVLLRRFAELQAPTYLALNVSPSTAVSEERAALLAGLPAERLVLEISEHAQVPD